MEEDLKIVTQQFKRKDNSDGKVGREREREIERDREKVRE
jgi:hypothetical protein